MTCVALWDTVRHSIFHIRSCEDALHTEKYHIMQSIYIYIYTYIHPYIHILSCRNSKSSMLFHIRAFYPLYHSRSSAALTQDLRAKQTQKQEDLSSWPAAHGVSSDCDSCAKAVGAVYEESYCTVLLKDMRKLHWNRCLMFSNAQTWDTRYKSTISVTWYINKVVKSACWQGCCNVHCL